jgi:hypothetical protein
MHFAATGLSLDGSSADVREGRQYCRHRQEIHRLARRMATRPRGLCDRVKNRVVALQVTGAVAAKRYSFNHIDLGSSTDTLVQYFGQPNHLEPSSEKDTDLWTYRSWPFSFEVKGGHVTSIRIAEPI